MRWLAVARTIVLGSRTPAPPQAVEEFLGHLWRVTSPNPLGPRGERIYGACLISAGPLQGIVWLKSIRAFETGEGYGSTGMEFIVNLADTYRVPVTLTPEPFGPKPRITKRKLRAWYQRFGFKLQSNGEMLYTPKRSELDHKCPECDFPVSCEGEICGSCMVTEIAK